ncbi:AAA family ATPase [Methanocalculus sp.]|uniref:AAA family ATPase n=1 Tax=Methanocalculus sp. TaxID=2004547 RepID=UPI002618341D|nr:AAA family ATPase [Methanocalculus sp.]MDG6250333.1 AAA family ATPase [Methanocalculus sp.]
MQQLKRLSVKNCRGIVNGPDIRFGTGGVLICGDNGTGKSSYVDALEKVLTGNCSSLDIRTQGLSWRLQGGHIFAEAAPEIELEISDGNLIRTITLESSPSSCPRPLKQFLQASREGGFILRRRTLLDFIDAKPADRWKAVETILNVAQFREFEQKLIDLNKHLREQAETAAESVLADETEIRELLGIEQEIPIDESSCIGKLNEKIRSLGLLEITSYEEIEVVLSTVKQHLAAFSDMEKWQRLLQFGELLRKAPIYQEIIDLISSYDEISQNIDEESKKLVGHFYEEVLKSGLQWIQEDKLESCPLCGSSISFNEVQSYVNQRLEEHSTIIQLKADRTPIHTDLIEKIRFYISFLDEVHEYLENGVTSAYSAQFEEFRKTIKKIGSLNFSVLDSGKIQPYLAVLKKQDDSLIISSMHQEIDETCTPSPDMERYKELFQLSGYLQTIPVHLDNIRYALKVIESNEYCQTQTDQLCALATQARKNAVQIFMEAISDTADELYQYVHPGESIGSLEINVRQRTNAGLELKSEFYGISGDPRGHYSEGHVDSLGLCIFLAIRRFQFQQCPDVALLVLDDVLHSVDGNHRLATAQMIFEKFNDHQILITTHDPVWFENLKFASRRHMNGKKFVQYKISDWNIKEGPIFGDHLNDYEWLTSDRCRTATPSDKAIKAGRLLEAMLQDLCHNLQMKVTYSKTGNYTIDPLWTSFYNTALRFKGFNEVSEDCLNQIEATRQVRNWIGAHWNEWALGLTNPEAQNFCNAVIELRKLVYCESCGQFIKRISDLDGVWACRGQHLKYKKN